MRSISVQIVLVVAAVLGLAGGSVHAQVPQEDEDRSSSMTITLVQVQGSTGLPAEGALLGGIAAFVDGEFCDGVALSEVTLAGAGQIVATLTIGEASQPASCRRARATILLYRGDGIQLFEMFVFEAGAHRTLTNLAPVLPDGTETVIDFPVGLPFAGSGGLADERGNGPTTARVAIAMVLSTLAFAAFGLRRFATRG